MKIKELDKRSVHWDFFALAIIVLFFAGVFYFQFSINEKPKLDADNELYSTINDRLDKIKGGDTFSDHITKIKPILIKENIYQIGNKNEYPFLEISNVSGSNYSEVHYFEVNTNKSQTLRIIRRIKDDKVLFARWIDNNEINIWIDYDKKQESLSKEPQQTKMNGDIITLKNKYPYLTN